VFVHKRGSTLTLSAAVIAVLAVGVVALHPSAWREGLSMLSAGAALELLGRYLMRTRAENDE
jgi:hypothetical protein